MATFSQGKVVRYQLVSGRHNVGVIKRRNSFLEMSVRGCTCACLRSRPRPSQPVAGAGVARQACRVRFE